VVTLVDEYNKVLADVRTTTQIAGVAYDRYADQDKVTRILIANEKVEMKEFRENNKGNRAERERIIAE
ncbi:hypothetical protein KI387_016174, partial [Taxus chinensis]